MLVWICYGFIWINANTYLFLIKVLLTMLVSVIYGCLILALLCYKEVVKDAICTHDVSLICISELKNHVYFFDNSQIIQKFSKSFKDMSLQLVRHLLQKNSLLLSGLFGHKVDIDGQIMKY